jgi:hypothetical protein
MRNKNDFIADLEAIEAENRATRKKFAALIKKRGEILFRSERGLPVSSDDAIWVNDLNIVLDKLDAARREVVFALFCKYLDLTTVNNKPRTKG